MRTIFHLTVLMMLVGLAGCSSTEQDWQAAQKRNTYSAYEQFLREHPDSEYAQTANARIAAMEKGWRETGARMKAEFAQAVGNLKKGMTVTEVSKVIGRSFGTLVPVTGKVTLPNGYWFTFLDGKLDDWRKE